MKLLTLSALVLLLSSCATQPAKVPAGYWRVTAADIEFCFDAGNDNLVCSVFPKEHYFR